MIEQLRKALARRQKQRIINASRIPSAVLIPVYEKQGQCHILFTRRTEKVKEHKGQISFPGGTYNKEDGTLVNTALRESAEEVGLAGGDIEILGELDDTITTTSSYIISPFVGLIPYPYQFRVNRDEIEEIIEVPIPALLDKGSLHCENEFVGDEVIVACYYHYQGHVIWGATARILNQFLGIVGQVIGS